MMIFVPEKQQQRHLPFFRENVDTAAAAAFSVQPAKKNIRRRRARNERR